MLPEESLDGFRLGRDEFAMQTTLVTLVHSAVSFFFENHIFIISMLAVPNPQSALFEAEGKTCKVDRLSV